ncbi:hypothetical protein ACIGNX_06155 [Actinosynnema sp. NPDC053489]|uniref:hypothetical protein n=1 Tax=Actinosynnema sp. NPDC053489 TaxID=3363916 RepID=UPI0037CAA030
MHCRRLVVELGASSDLAAAIDSWDEEFQAIYDRSDLPSSSFPGEATTAAWRERGERSTGRLASTLRVRTEFRTRPWGTRVDG